VPQIKVQAASAVRNFYPAELIVTVNNKKIQTNVKEPYSVGSILVIDTKAAAEDYPRYQPKMLLTDSLLIVPDNTTSGTFKALPLEDVLKDVPNGTVFDKSLYTQITERYLPWLNYLPAAISLFAVLSFLILPWVAGFFSLVGWLLALLLISLLLWIVAKIMKKSLGYGKVYQLAMHGTTAAVLLSFVAGSFGVRLGIVPSLVTLVFTAFALSRLKPSSSAS
jgi:hypothetical protein